MDSARSGSGNNRRGVVLVAVVALIGAAWIFATFGGGLASAAGSAKERVNLMFMSDEEEIDRAVEEYAGTFDYEGSSGREYREEKEEVVTGDYWDSPQGESVQEFAEVLDESEEVYVHEAEVVGRRTVERGEEHRRMEVTYRGKGVWGGETLYDGRTRNQVMVVKLDGRWRVGWADETEELDEDGS